MFGCLERTCGCGFVDSDSIVFDGTDPLTQRPAIRTFSERHSRTDQRVRSDS